jgi:DNA alkylation damage repair protein AlkB
MDEFKKCLIRFRRRPNDPDRTDDLDQLIDFSNETRHEKCLLYQSIERVTVEASQLTCYQGHLYTLSDFPGFLYAPNALSKAAQLQLAYQSVALYCQAPHTTNIHLVPPKEHETMTELSMWELWKREHYYSADKGLLSCHCKPHYMSFHKLAWSTMGYHYDWTARTYPTTMASSVPSDLEELSQVFAKASLLHNNPDLTAHDSIPAFHPTATIVNFYHSKSIMGPHRDDSEHAVTKPIVSFSMGRPAVFLLGGDTKNDPVVPILVRPGDVMIMGGATRLNYHCMARLLPAHAGTNSLMNGAQDAVDDPPEHQIAEIQGMPVPNEAEQAALKQYLLEHRININLRQVYDN